MSQAIKVGLFALVALVLLGVMVLKIERIDLFSGPDRSLIADFETVAGLDDKAAVRVAGVRVGRVDGIALEAGRARVRLVIEQPLELGEGTRAVIANMGLLGDKYVVLEPGPAGAPALAEGALIPGESPPSFDDILAELQGATKSLSGLGGLGGGPGGGLDRLIANLEAVSSDIRVLVAANRDEIGATIANLRSFSGTLARELPTITRQAESVLAQIDETLGVLGTTVGESGSDFQASASNLRLLSEQARGSVDALNQITARLARGEGSLGKLLNSDEAHDQLVNTLSSVESGVETLSGTLGGIQKIQLELGLESYYLQGIEESRSALNVNIDPQTGRLYRVGLVDSPFGKEETRLERKTVTRDDGTSDVTVTETLVRTDDFELSALFGFRLFDDTRAWVGVIESAGGVQIEHPLLADRVTLSLEAFDFDREGDLDPHLRLSARYKVGDMLYLTGGYDDFLVGERDSFFLGGGLTWRDDTLKYLLGSIPGF